VDGVGGYLVCTGEQVTIGGRGPADFCIQGPLSRHHATFTADEERWWLESHGPTALDGGKLERDATTERNMLPASAELRLGAAVRVRVSVPNPLSMTAVLTPVSGHRPALGVDGCVLMRQNMILAPGEAAHVRCPDWPGKLVLFESRGVLLCQPLGLGENDAIGGRTGQFGEPIRPGDVVEGDGFPFRFHIEPVA
jgi:hypothetical protein